MLKNRNTPSVFSVYQHLYCFQLGKKKRETGDLGASKPFEFKNEPF
jgi:hypothetical protein